MNKCIFIGRATAVPELRYTQDGKAFAVFSLAVDDGFGENKHTFFNTIANGKTAESLVKYVQKGDKLGIVTSARQQEYTTKEGQKRRDISFRLETWEFAQSAQRPSDGQQGQPGQSAARPPQTQAAARPPQTQAPPDGFMDIPPGYYDEMPFT